jgi:hypothetical protein
MICSEGFLSGTSMAWHAGKPLALLFALSALVCLSGRGTFMAGLGLWLSMALGGLSDEGFWPAFLGAWCLALAMRRDAASGADAALA